MRLRRLEAYGFKSFADRAVFVFEDGITAIVGPNGCGKSNVVDAIKWVIGEQSAKALRGTEMADVIFNGCATRRGMAFAEVTITLDQIESALPIDAPEIAITRRLARDGQSSYYINGKACRLKDIKDLLLGTGIGVSAYAVIEQGRIGFILESNTKDRRLILEEAAGISRYRARRRIAARKLERVETDLRRIAEVLGEVRRRARQVRKQAADALRYRELTMQAKQLRLALAIDEWERLQAQSRAVAAELDALGVQEAHACAAAAQLEARVAEEDARLAPAEAAIRAAERARADAQSARDVAAAQIAEVEAQLADLAATESADRAALATVGERLASLARQHAEAERRLSELRAGHDEAAIATLDARRAELAAAVQRVDALLARLEESKSQQVECLREQARIEAETRAMESARQAILARRQRLDERSGPQHERLAAAIQALEAARQHLAQAQRAAAEAHLALDQALSAQAAADTEAERLARQLSDIRHAEARTETMLRVLAEHERRAEGVSRPVREVLREAGLSGMVGMVADLCRVPDDCVLAIETALGGAAQHIVTERVEDAKAAVEWLNRERRGRATFLPLDDIRGDERVDERLLGERGVVGIASRLVSFDERLRPVFEYLLGNVVVVETLDHAIALRRRHRPRCRLVTLDGSHINPSGAITGGTSSHADGSGLISRKHEIAKLNAELAELGRNRALVADALEAAKAEVQRWAAECEARRRDIQACDRLAAEARAAVAQAERDLAHAEEGASSQGAELEEIARELAQLEAEAKELAGQRDWFAAVQQRLETERARVISELDAAAAQRDRLQEEVNALRVAAAAAREREEAARNHLAHLARQMQEVEDDRAERERRLASLDARRGELQRRAAAAREARQAAESALEHAEQAVVRAVAERDRLRQASEELRIAARAASAQARELTARLQDRRLAANELALRLEHLAQRVRDEQQIEIAEAAAHWQRPANWDRAAAEREAADLEAAIARLGPVNLAAIDELEEAEARERFIAESHADLVAASDRLQQTIAEIDTQCRRLFEDAYRAVRGHFQDLFRRLFGGGSADLRLERIETVTVTDPDGTPREVQREVDILEAGLEIVAQPPGKNPKVITQLSGGEKALAAIALLFAVYRAKPSPFCVLDEVDAPLDEANVDVYCNMLRDFTRRGPGHAGSQFIVITHKKRTMQRADAIYGITQNEPGVSTCISVKLDEALQGGLLPTTPGAGPYAG
ncbi:MAG: chromosome segregation protein SMC [Planctomycetes bacterium]|nr:chromosome segregation protein SMC [Planctomycetota bacterium]